MHRSSIPIGRDASPKKLSEVASGTPSPLNEYQIVHRSGEVRWVHQRNVPIIDVQTAKSSLSKASSATSQHASKPSTSCSSRIAAWRCSTTSSQQPRPRSIRRKSLKYSAQNSQRRSTWRRPLPPLSIPPRTRQLWWRNTYRPDVQARWVRPSTCRVTRRTSTFSNARNRSSSSTHRTMNVLVIHAMRHDVGA